MGAALSKQRNNVGRKIIGEDGEERTLSQVQLLVRLAKAKQNNELRTAEDYQEQILILIRDEVTNGQANPLAHPKRARRKRF